MKAVLLAGGYATRLWPITRHRPKMFLPLGERTVVDRLFDELEAVDRVEDVYVSTNERFAGEFESYLADSPYEKPRLSVEGTRAEDEKFGVVGALGELIEREGIDDDLLVIAGDNVFEFAIQEFLAAFDRWDAPTIAVNDVGDPELARSYGVVDLDDDRVVGFEEKPDSPPGTRVSTGCYAFPRETLPRFDSYLEGDTDPDEPGWFVAWLRERTPTYAFSFDGAWFDVGTLESYLDAVAWQLDGESLVAETASVEDSSIGPAVHVMGDATVTDSELERSVVFPDASLAASVVRDSVVDQGAELGNAHLEGAAIGAYTRIPDGSPG